MNKDRIYSSRSNAAPSVVGKKRTRFNLSCTRRYTCNTGDFVPVYCEEVLPGDTFDIKTAVLTRLQTSLHQTLDNAFLEIAFFYVPNRIVMDDWDKLLGANDDPWARQNAISTPQILLKGVSTSPINPGVVAPMSILNHLMLPAGNYLTHTQYSGMSEEDKAGAKVTQLPLRGVFQVYNDWMRSENLDSIIAFSKGNSDIDLGAGFAFNSGYLNPAQWYLKVNRFHDRFSSALPAPQKSAPVTFNLSGNAPIITGNYHSMGGNLQLGDNSTPAANGQKNIILDPQSSTGFPYNVIYGTSRDSDGGAIGMADVDMVGAVSASNLYADLSRATAITVNDLRLAIATQVLAEQEARGGTRLQEVLFSQWNLKAPSLMLDRSEYLGGKRIPLSMLEVVQTSETNGTQLLGNVAGLGKTFDADSGSALKSFMLHGYVLGFAWIRTARSYSQGIDRKFFRSDKYSYFNPIFDNIGELPVYAKELLVPTLASNFDVNNHQFGQVFGYQEAWYEYKEGLNRDTGYMQTGINGSMDTWHYGDNYSSLPLLAHDWLKEGVTNVDRTIAVKSTASYGFQWMIMLDFEVYATRQMAKYSIPNTFGFGSR